MEKTASITLPATPMVSHGSWGSRAIGTHESTMDLYIEDGGKSGMIEWDIPDLETTEHIGLWFAGRTLKDYDGVSDLPKEAVSFLRAQGYTVPADFE